MKMTKGKMDLSKILKPYGLGEWRRPFKDDPRCEELDTRVKNVPTVTSNKVGPERGRDGDIVNFEQ